MQKRYIYVVIGFLINTCLGAVYAWSVFRKPLEEVLEVGATQSGLPFSIFLAVFAFSMPFTGALIPRWGARNCIILGGILLGSGWLLSGYADNIYLLIFTYGVLGGLGVGMIYGVPLAVSSAWFTDNKGLAIGLTLSGYGISPFFIAPLGSWLIRHYSVFGAFEILGIAFAVLLVLLALPMRFPTEKEKLPTQGNNTLLASTQKQFTIKEMLATKEFYALWICYMIAMFVGLGVISFSKSAGKEIFSLTEQAATVAVSVFGIFNGIGRPIFGTLSDSKGIFTASVVTYILMIIASLMVLLFRDIPLAYYLSFPLIWMSLGGWLSIAPMATISFFGTKNYSRNYGLVFTAYGVGALGGSLVSGSIKDIFKNYINFFYPVIGLALIGILLSVLFLRTQNKNN